MKPDVDRKSENTTFFSPRKNFSKKQLNRKNHNILFKAVLYATLTPLKLFKNSWKFLKILKNFRSKKFKKSFRSKWMSSASICMSSIYRSDWVRPGFWIFICLGWWYRTSGSFDSLLDNARMSTWPWHSRDQPRIV